MTLNNDTRDKLVKEIQDSLTCYLNYMIIPEKLYFIAVSIVCIFEQSILDKIEIGEDK